MQERFTEFEAALLTVLDRIAEALEAQVDLPVNIRMTDLSPDEAEVLSRGLADAAAGRVTPFDPRNR